MQPQKLRIAYFLFVMIFFIATTQSFAISAIIPLSHHRGRIYTEMEKQTNTAHDLGPDKTTKRATEKKSLD